MNENIAEFCKLTIKRDTRLGLKNRIVVIEEDGEPTLADRKLITSYWLKKHKAIAIEIPYVLSDDDEIAIAQLALAVGRRLERFERGQKANAGRDATSRKQIAQNAIKKRWSAK